MCLDHKYLKADQLRGFDHYKYSSVDTSPLAIYISHPFWNWFVNFYPEWLAPNVLTLAGALVLMGCYTLISVLDWRFEANSTPTHNLPQWVWLLAALCTFSAHLLDGTDGKQARRTGSSGPTGELFDHGLDSWATVPFTLTLFSIFGRGEFSVSPISLLTILIAVQAVFIVTHWEKYNTGILFLSWGYDASQYGLSVIYLFTYFAGHKFYHFHVFGPWLNFAQIFMIGFYFSCILQFSMSAYNIYVAYFVKGDGKQSSVIECVRPLVSPLTLFTVAVAWAFRSPTEVISEDPRTFLWAMGVVFSNVASRLIIAQMSSTRAQLVNKLLVVYALVASCALSGLLDARELLVLRVFAVFSTLAHVHFGVCVVRQLCEHFGIQAFSLEYLERRKAK